VSIQPAARVASLDAFRGFAIASMVLVNNPGDWGHLYAPLEHAAWNGWTFTDLVFPFFLFAAGLSMAVSLDRRLRTGEDRAKLLASTARRAAVIFGVGFALNLFPTFDFSTVRIPGVLQRIALCIVIAAPVAIYARTRWLAASIVILMALYTGLMLFVPVPGPDGVVAAGVLEPGRDFGAWLDRLVFGDHLWKQSRTWDPEGLVSTLPAACSVLFGVATGRWLLRQPSSFPTSARLLVVGMVALGVGLDLGRDFLPINKNLWTPAYCVFMTGWALVAFALFHATMDARAFGRRLFLPLTIYGMNALFIFAFSGFVARLLILGNGKRVLYAPIEALPIAPENASLLFAIAFDLAMLAVAWFLWKKRWYVRA
jgi:predicted acyltransferase